MSFEASWALVGLAALPVLWWLHRRRQRPPVRAMPSLMFFVDEDEARSLPRERRLDAELLLSLCAAALLALGAAGLLLARGAGGRVIRVVVAQGAPSMPAAPRVHAALDAIRAAAGADDDVQIVFEPPGGTMRSPRPSEAALLGAARAGEASLRIVIDDRLPAEPPPDVTWVGVGRADVRNAGIVAASVDLDEQGHPVVFANVVNDAPDARRITVSLEGAGPEARTVGLDVGPGAVRSLRVPLGAGSEQIVVRIRHPDTGHDALLADDRVLLTRHPRAVFVDPALPARLRAAVRRALDAALGPGGARFVGLQDAAYAFVPRGRGPSGDARPWVLELEHAPDGAALDVAPAGIDDMGRGPLAGDLGTAAADWVYALGAHVAQEGEVVLLARRAAELWPVLLRRGRTLRLAPDPLRGQPAPVDTPFWPLLVDNLLRAAGDGGEVGAGYRAEGLLDLASSHLGHDERPFDPAVLATAGPVGAPGARALRPFLVAGALACLLLLWLAPWIRSRTWRAGGRPAPRAP